MNEGKISVRYSKALFLTAKEKGVVEEVREDMVYILYLSTLQEVKDLFGSPVINNQLKGRALAALLEGRVGELTMNLAKLTVNNNRESYLPGIARCYIDTADRFKGITKATLTTATRVSESVKSNISNLIEEGLSTTADMTQVIDPDIIGGFLLRVEDILIDGSVKSQLRNIRNELKQEKQRK